MLRTLSVGLLVLLALVRFDSFFASSRSLHQQNEILFHTRTPGSSISSTITAQRHRHVVHNSALGSMFFEANQIQLRIALALDRRDHTKICWLANTQKR